MVIYDEAAALLNPPTATQLDQAEQALRAVLNSTISGGGSTGDIGRDLRLELRAELSATQIHEHLVRVRLAANTDPNAAQTLAALEAHETELWDAIGNAQQLR